MDEALYLEILKVNMGGALRRKINHTWQKLSRDRHLLAKEYSMNDHEYRLWDLLVASFDWDTRHTESYGTVATTDKELASFLGWSASTVCRHRNSLQKKKIIDQINTGEYRLLLNSSMQGRIASPQVQIATMQDHLAPVQSVAGEQGVTPLVSFKDSLEMISNPSEISVVPMQSDQGILTIDDKEYLQSTEYLHNITFVQSTEQQNNRRVESLSLREIMEAMCPA